MKIELELDELKDVSILLERLSKGDGLWYGAKKDEHFRKYLRSIARSIDNQLKINCKKQ